MLRDPRRGATAFFSRGVAAMCRTVENAMRPRSLNVTIQWNFQYKERIFLVFSYPDSEWAGFLFIFISSWNFSRARRTGPDQSGTLNWTTAAA